MTTALLSTRIKHDFSVAGCPVIDLYTLEKISGTVIAQ
jgi:hypothetical protein